MNLAAKQQSIKLHFNTLQTESFRKEKGYTRNENTNSVLIFLIRPCKDHKGRNID